ncbi:acyltransferase family protein [Vibrio vulnificus]|uniref:acyltransferase family protein n=1 Tax=Vibrio vulnificus TaxID=672 RepID=UPI003D9C9D55
MRQQLPILTPIRGFAAILVALFHARLVIFPQWQSEIASVTQFLENSYLWVDTFFILSGFVMMHVYKETFQNGVMKGQWRHFMWLRFCRIYPLFFLTFTIVFCWESNKAINDIGFYGGALMDSWGLTGIPAFGGPFNTSGSIVSNLLLIHGLTETSLTWNIASWSLSIEWLCYMVFPFLIPCLMSGGKDTYWLPALAYLILYSLVSTAGTLDLTGGYQAFLRGLCGFSLGAWLYQVQLPTQFEKWIRNDLVLVFLFGLIIFLMHQKMDVGSVVLCHLLFSLLVLCSAKQQGRNSPVLKIIDNRVTQMLGDISYSTYLWHAVILLIGVEVINIVNPEFLTWWYQQTDVKYLWMVVSFYLFTIIFISIISYYQFEKPMLKVLRGWKKGIHQIATN